jgi:formylglycine-generating enzyme required for sulfatase activity
MKRHTIVILVVALFSVGSALAAFTACPSADLSGDCFVDYEDFALMGEKWLNGYDYNDLAEMANQWLSGYPNMTYIPGGEFEMGDHFAPEGYEDELPVHAVLVDAFFMGRFEITNQQYCDYLNSALPSGSIYLFSNVVYGTENGQGYCDTSASSSYSPIVYSGGIFTVGTKDGRDRSDDPMVMVSWYGASAYCNWRSGEEGYESCYNLSTWEFDFSKNGYRLPTEAEWEYAARGGNDSPYYRYPWGDSIGGSKANYWNSGDPYEAGDYPWTTPVGYYDGSQIPAGSDMANGYGLYDMTGNVFEWCNDWYDENYYDVSPYDNPTGPAGGTSRVFRGSGWVSLSNSCRVAIRGIRTPNFRIHSYGFRLALNFNPMDLDIALFVNNSWMYQNLPTATASNLTANLLIIDDPGGNINYTYDWEFILPDDVTIEPSTIGGGESADTSWNFAAPGANEPNGLSDSGGAFTVKVTVTGDDYGNTGTAEAQFGIALLGDVNNDTVIDVADRGIVNSFWRTGSAGSFSLTDCDLNSDGSVDIADRGIANAVWRGTLGQSSVSSLCPLRQVATGMVFIPGGEFEMGDHFVEGFFDELPIRAVLIDAFFMSRFEISNQQYCDYLNSAYPAQLKVEGGIIYASSDSGNNYPYCDTHGYDTESRIDFSDSEFSVRTKDSRDMSDDPMVEVSWYGAAAYCNWRSNEEGFEDCYNLSTWECDFSKQGYRLSTEAEWEYAARGGLSGQRFPWGDTISHGQANYYAAPGGYSYDVNPTSGYHSAWHDSIVPYTAPVGSFSANGYGLYDMTGNGWEWCNDWYSGNYYSVNPYDNPQGPAGGAFRALRGCCWFNLANYCRVAYRNLDYPETRSNQYGFRIVLDFE